MKPEETNMRGIQLGFLLKEQKGKPTNPAKRICKQAGQNQIVLDEVCEV